MDGKKVFVEKCILGIIAVSDRGELVDYIKFPKDPKKIAEKIDGTCPEEKKLEDKLKKRGYTISKTKKKIDLSAINKKIGFCKESELIGILSEVNSELTKKKISEDLKHKDKLIIQAIRAFRELETTINQYSELLREWYSIHFPELSPIVEDNITYATLIKELGNKKSFNETNLNRTLDEKKLIRGITKVAPQSIGIHLDENDLSEIKNFSRIIEKLDEERKKLEGYIDKSMNELAPNLSAVATPKVGAKLIDEAGSLERLSKLPSSTIQILGASKAMFRFLKTKKKPPKYGVLFMHPLVSQAPRSQKGKIARSLAAKIATAAKIDYYGGEFIGDKLLTALQKKFRE